MISTTSARQSPDPVPGVLAVPGGIVRGLLGVLVSDLIFAASVDGLGRLRFDQPEIVANELRALAGKRVNVHVKRERNTRTNGQNKYQWATYGEVVAEATELVELATGVPVFRTREDVHGWAKLAFLRRPVMTNRGEINLLGTTTTLTEEEHAKFMLLIFAKLANLGVYIPEYAGR